MEYMPQLWLFVAATVIMAALIVIAWRYRQSDLGRAFVLVMGCACVWSVFYILEMMATSLQATVIFSKVQFFGICGLGPAWVWMARVFTGKRFTRGQIVALLAVPALTLLVIWTDPLHHGFYGQVTFSTDLAPIPLLAPDYQFWFYWVHGPSGYIYMTIAAVMLVSSMARSQRPYRQQAWGMLLAIALPVLVDLTYVMGLSPIRYINYTTAAFSVSGLILAYTLRHWRLLDIRPLAHHAVMAAMPDGVLVLDLQGRIVDVNTAAIQQIGEAAARVGQAVSDSDNVLLSRVSAMLATNPSGELSSALVGLSGDADRYFSVRLASVTRSTGQIAGHVVILRDETERTRLTRELERLASHDDLTGLLNRRAFLQQFERELYRCGRQPGYHVALMMIDMDYLKTINDQHGHLAGDEALRAFSRAIQPELRAIDLFARLGGDEFGLLLTNVRLIQARQVIDRIVRRVRDTHATYMGHALPLSASAGLVCTAQLESSQWNVQHMLRLADTALYQSKAEGRDRYTVAETFPREPQ